jgi:spermidine/putrescine transport system ATP-binding protein
MLKLSGLNKRFGENIACKDIDLEINKGECFYLLGPSGCGKSTLLSLIAGHLLPDSGDISLNGKSLLELPPNKRPIHTIFQSYALFPHLNVFENVAFSLKLKGEKGIEERVARKLELVSLTNFAERYPDELSGGQQQRVAIARAIIDEPTLLLLDEPFGALDTKLRKEMQLELKELQRKLGMTFICVTHDQEEALSLADRLAVMNHGRIEQLGTPESVYDSPDTRFVASFIGESNILDGIVDNDRIILSEKISIPINKKFNTGEARGVVIRPEWFELDDGASVFSLSGRVLSRLFQGSSILYLIETELGKIKVLVPVDDDLSPKIIGDSVTIRCTSGSFEVV